MGDDLDSKTGAICWDFEGVIARRLRASHSSSRMASSHTAFLAQDRFAMSLMPPFDFGDRHMPGYLLSGATSPKRRRPANNRQPVPWRRHVSWRASEYSDIHPPHVDSRMAVTSAGKHPNGLIIGVKSPKALGCAVNGYSIPWELLCFFDFIALHSIKCLFWQHSGNIPAKLPRFRVVQFRQLGRSGAHQVCAALPE